MSRFFAVDYHGAPFVLFGIAHLTALAIILALNAVIIATGRRWSAAGRAAFRYSLAALLVVNRVALHIWYLINDLWSVQWQLPLHLCSVMLWLSIYMLLSRSYTAFEFVYFLGIGGASQALLTPDAGPYGFPHFYPMQFFISHGGTITAAVYMAAVEGFRPTTKSIRKVFLWGNVYLLTLIPVNLLLGSNYMYTLHKPPVPTLLDYLGPWPWYLLSGQVIALVIFLLLYAPFRPGDAQSPAGQSR